MIKNISEIEQSLGLESGKFSEMMTSEDEHSVDLSGFVIENKSDYDTKLSNLKKTWQTNATEEMIKHARTEHELDFQGKTMENFIDAFKNKVETESSKEPESRFSEMKTKFEKMQSIATEWEEKHNSLNDRIRKDKNQFIIDNSLLKEIPENTKIDKNDILSILKTRNQFDLSEDGSIVVMKNGKPLVNDKTLNNLGVSDFMKTFTKPYLKEVEGGHGEGQQGQAKAGSFEAFEKEMESKGFTAGSEAYNTEMSKRIGNKTLTF